MTWILRALADSPGRLRVLPVATEEAMIDAILGSSVDRPRDGRGPARGGRHPGHGHLPRRPSRPSLPTPSGRVEFYSERALELGLPPLPVHDDLPSSRYPLVLRQGPNPHALPRLLRSRTRPADAGQARSRAAALDRPAGCRRARSPGRRRDSHLQRTRRVRGPRAGDGHIPPGTVWMRDGWEGLNRLTSGAAAIPDAAVDVFGFAAGQSTFDARVDVALA